MRRPSTASDDVRDLIVRCLALYESDGPVAVDALLDSHPDSAILVRKRLDLLRDLGLMGEAPQDAPPERVGPYRVVGVLGRGGMGVVYEAEQERPRRRVALKLLRSWPGERGRARFEHEAELLARLQHPAIAAIHEVGTAQVGGMTVPYFAMELVRGRPLDAYAAEERPDRATRVALLARIADAVHHAHLRGVVHRDLKPRNVLVDDEGDPHVLDFGVARAIDPDLEIESLRTQTGQVLGTLPYMSPEQAAGRAAQVDAQSDVYSLGVLAFELLTGQLPIDLAGLSVLDSIRAIDEREPPRLGELDPALRGDLETIVATALAHEKERRYASAHALAADLRRHLASEPIGARPASAAYLLAKFARRHRALVAGAAAVLVALVLGLVGTLYGLASAARERDDAQARFEQAASLLDFQELMYEVADPGGQGVRMEDLLDRAELLVESSGADATGRAAIRLLLGKANRGIGRYERAEPLVAQAVETFERELGPDDLQSLSARVEWAELLRQPLGRPRDAERVVEGVAERAARAHGATSEVALSARMVTAALGYDFVRFREGLAVAREVGDLAERGSPPWIAARTWQANFLKELGDVEEALAIAREDLDWSLATHGREHPRTWQAMNTLGTSLYGEGRTQAGLPVLEELYELRTRFLGADHPSTVDTRIKVAGCLLHAGELARGEELLLEAVEQCDRSMTPDHPTRLYALNGLASCYQLQGRFAEAEPIEREVFERTSDLRGPAHRNTLKSMANLAGTLSRLGRSDEAEELYREVLALQRLELGDRHADTLNTCHMLGGFYTFRRRFEEAEALLVEAVEVGREALGSDHEAVGVFLRTYGECLFHQGRFAEAEPALLESLEWCERTFGAEHEEFGKVLFDLQRLYAAWGRPERAAEYAELLAERDS